MLKSPYGRLSSLVDFFKSRRLTNVDFPFDLALQIGCFHIDGMDVPVVFICNPQKDSFTLSLYNTSLALNSSRYPCTTFLALNGQSGLTALNHLVPMTSLREIDSLPTFPATMGSRRLFSSLYMAYFHSRAYIDLMSSS